LSPDLERRDVQWPADPTYQHELRADQSKIVGHAVVCDVRSRDLGGFVEVVAPAAITRALTANVVALFNHDANQVLGRTPKTLTLSRDARGLAFVLDPAPTQAGRDALELVRRGDVAGASFGFRTVRDHWTRDGGTTVRTLLDIELLEISLTALPSYQQTDVSVALRSLHMQPFARDTQPFVSRVQPIASLRRQLRLR
jgi:HK97 family phage prohead protease